MQEILVHIVFVIINIILKLIFKIYVWLAIILVLCVQVDHLLTAFFVQLMPIVLSTLALKLVHAMMAILITWHQCKHAYLVILLAQYALIQQLLNVQSVLLHIILKLMLQPVSLCAPRIFLVKIQLWHANLVLIIV